MSSSVVNPHSAEGRPLGFTVTQKQRLRELGSPPAVAEQCFASTHEREQCFQQLERELTGLGREHLADVRAGTRVPALTALQTTLSTALTQRGFVEVVTPHIISREAVQKMGVLDDDSLGKQIYWVDRNRCLRPMLAPSLYIMLRRLGQTLERPFGIFEIGTCFRRDSHGGRHLDEFTMLNLVELGTPLEARDARLRTLAELVLAAAEVTQYEFTPAHSAIYGETIDVMAGGVEVCSTAIGPLSLDDAWGITEPWVGLGFGLERLLMARDGHATIERVARSLSYYDGVRLNL